MVVRFLFWSRGLPPPSFQTACGYKKTLGNIILLVEQFLKRRLLPSQFTNFRHSCNNFHSLSRARVILSVRPWWKERKNSGSRGRVCAAVCWLPLISYRIFLLFYHVSTFGHGSYFQSAAPFLLLSIAFNIQSQ